MSDIQYLENSNTDFFWDRLQKLISSRDKEYVNSVSSNVISLSNIKFPAIDIDKVNTYLFPSNSTNSSRRIIFDTCIFEDEVKFDDVKPIDEIKLNNCKFKKNVSIALRPIKTLYLNKCIFEDEIVFKDVIVSKQDKSFIFKNSEVVGTLKITDCYLEYAQFYNLDLQNATIEISNTIAVGLKCNNVNWSNKFNCNRDTYRQLKVVMEEHKNYIDANFFHSLELNEYRKELFKKPILDSIGEKVLFGLNWLVSNFSTSWIRPLLLLIVFSVLSYCFTCYRHYIEFCSMNSFFEFFNPLSKTASNEYKDIYWLWFLHKVISGFLLYHFIVSMKKSSRF